MNSDLDIIADAAAAWHAASLHDDMDWDGFTAWLEADPRHRTAYDEVALADALAVEHAPAPVIAANDDEAAPSAAPRWWRWGGAAIAASLLALVVAPQIMPPASVVYATEGQSRTVALKDGSRIVVAPHSRLEVGGRHQDRLALSGGGWFDIRHDPARAMEIRAGELTISDIGTSFDIQASAGRVRVEVAEGQVSLVSGRLARPIALAVGHAAEFDGARGTSFVSTVDQGNIGEWREGRLSYDSAPLALVAADLARYAGVQVIIPPALGQRRFSGTLNTGNGETALRDLSQLMGLELGRRGSGFELSE